MVLFTGQKHTHSNTSNVHDERKMRRVDTSKKYGCVCTCCQRKNLMRCDCVIFVKKNYDTDNTNIPNALSNRYREVGNKEFICKPCHTRLQNKHDNTQNSHSVDNSKNIDIMNSNDTTPLMEFNTTSLDFTQNPTYTNHCICTCCHKPDLPRSQCIIFKVQRYNSDNTVISQALSNHFIIATGKEFICKKCDKSLLAEKMPADAVDARCRLEYTKQKICVYCKGTSTKSILFDITAYRNNLLASQIHDNSMLHHDSVICEKCHNTILQESLVICIICEQTVAKRCLVGKHKYASLKQTMPQIANIPNNKRHICNICYMQLQQNFVCVCCSRSVEKSMCQLYNKVDYDFSNFVVSRCLPHVRDCIDEQKYICLSCHKRLREMNNDKIVLPYHGRYPHVTAGTNFLKSLQEMPQFVCTCCHCMLFSKTVKPFNIREYDMNNDIVQKCLSHCYRLTLQKSVPATKHVETIKNEWPTIEDRQSEADNTYTMSEFICIWCRNVLRQKKMKMPDQACANGLKLHNIPQELESITPLECRLVAECIPFLTILLMKRYGGHYKVNGPCVNVPTHLDQVLEILPRMPNELQLHPLKLKCKLEYKSHYMYNMI